MTDDSAPAPADDVEPANGGPSGHALPPEGDDQSKPCDGQRTPAEQSASATNAAPAWRQRPTDSIHTMPRWPRRPTTPERPPADQQRGAASTSGEPDDRTRINPSPSGPSHTVDGSAPSIVPNGGDPSSASASADFPLAGATSPPTAPPADAPAAGPLSGPRTAHTPPAGIAGPEPGPLIVVGRAVSHAPRLSPADHEPAAADAQRAPTPGPPPGTPRPRTGRRARPSPPLEVEGRPADHSVTRTRLVAAPPPSSPPTQAIPHAHRPRRGRWLLAAAGALVAIVALVVVTAWLWPAQSDTATTTRLPSAPPEPTTVAPERLAVGNCLASIPMDTAVIAVEVVPCSHPHRGEVVASYRFTDHRYPGDAVIAQTLDEYCTTAVSDAARKAGLTSVGMWYLAPHRSDWTRHQPGHCVAISSSVVTASLMQRIAPLDEGTP